MDDFDILRENLAVLMKARGIDSQKMMERVSGVSQGHISNIMRREKTPSLGIVEQLARVFKLRSWQLLTPHLTNTVNADADTAQLLHYYAAASDDAKKVILQVAQAQARATHPESS